MAVHPVALAQQGCQQQQVKPQQFKEQIQQQQYWQVQQLQNIIGKYNFDKNCIVKYNTDN